MRIPNKCSCSHLLNQYLFIIEDTITGYEDGIGLEGGGIAAFDSTGDRSTVGPHWRRWKKSLPYFILAKGVKGTQPKAGDTYALRWPCSIYPLMKIQYWVFLLGIHTVRREQMKL